MRNLLLITLIIYFHLYTVMAQTAGYRLPEKYIAKMKIKKLTEFELGPKKDTVFTITYFYKDGKVSQRTRYMSSEFQSVIDIDPNYINSKIAFYESYTYDNKGRLNFSAASWTGLKEPYILADEYFYSNDGDTTYKKSYSYNSGDGPIWKSPHLNRRDSAVIDRSCMAYFTSDKDTILYKYAYRANGKDSIIYSRDYAKSNYHYEVYENGSLVDFGIIFRNPNELNAIIPKYRIFFDKSGLPYKSSNYLNSNNESFISEIEIETY